MSDGGSTFDLAPGYDPAERWPADPLAAGPTVVAVGGGHGLAASLKALRTLTLRLTAVVTVADDGGSSGQLRRELGVLPPGDLRRAMAALCPDDERGRLLATLLEHRFGGDGPLFGHAVGNLVLAGLDEVLGDPVAALDLVARLVGACGRVLPAAEIPLDLAADVAGLDRNDPARVRRVRGQAAVASTPGTVLGVALLPEDPPAGPAAVAAIHEADWVVVGPGSWFTSVMPHVLVPGLRDAIATTSARRMLVLNLAAQPGETSGFSPGRHLEVLADHAPGLTFDVVLADVARVDDPDALREAARRLQAEVVLAPVARDDGTPRHDARKLARAYDAVFNRTAADPDQVSRDASGSATSSVVAVSGQASAVRRVAPPGQRTAAPARTQPT